MTTAGVPPGLSSSDERPRPSAKRTPKVSKKLDETSLPSTCSGAPGLVRSNASFANAAIRANGVPVPIDEIRVRKIGRVPEATVEQQHQHQPVGIAIRQRL